MTFCVPSGCGLDALCRVLEVWVRHFTGAAVSVQPVQRVDDQRWVWHVGLDNEASALLNDLYDGKEIEEVRRPRVRGRPVSLGLAITAAQRLELKPHNLLINLPLARPA